MPKLKPVIGDVKNGIVAQLCAVSGRDLQTGAIEYKLGGGLYIKVNPNFTLTDERKSELTASSKPKGKVTVSPTPKDDSK